MNIQSWFGFKKSLEWQRMREINQIPYLTVINLDKYFQFINSFTDTTDTI